MSSTNKTTNYELSQFVGSDKPTWLGDYNSDMGKIDTQMKANNTAVTTAQSTADTAVATSNTALSNSNTAIDTSTTASATATSALNKALANETAISKFNLTNIKSIDTSDITVTGGKTINSNTLSVATNSDGSIGKIYGRVNLTGSGSGNISFQTDLRPTENITINGCMIRNITTSAGHHATEMKTFTINTNGLVTAPYTWVDNSSNNCDLMFIACLLFMKNFGDQPDPD